MRAALVPMWCSQLTLELPTSPYVNTSIVYQGVTGVQGREKETPRGRRRSESDNPAPGDPNPAPAAGLSARAALRELVDRCIAGDCDDATAAKLVGIRRATFSEYVRSEKIRRRAMRQLEGAFHATFPECNPRLASTARTWVEQKPDELFREGPPSPCVTYTAEEAESLPPSQPHLLMPDAETEVVSYNTNREVGEFIPAIRRPMRDENNPSEPDFTF